MCVNKKALKFRNTRSIPVSKGDCRVLDNQELLQKEEYQGKGEKKYDVDVLSTRSQSLMSSITNPFFDCSKSATSGGTKANFREVPITDVSLDARNGALFCRLDRKLDHLTEKPTVKRGRCGLHWWGAKVRKKSDMKCPSCNVHLCNECYSIFHRVPELVVMKKRSENEWASD